MMALSMVCPPLALVVMLSTFRRAFPCLQQWRRHRLYVAASTMGVFWVLVVVIVLVVVTVPGA